LGERISKDSTSKYVLIVVVLILAIISFLIIYPFIRTILASFIIAYIFYPAYKIIRKYIHKDTLAALVMSIFIVLIIAVPVIFIGNAVSKEVKENYQSIRNLISTGNFLNGNCTGHKFSCNIVNYFVTLLEDPQIKPQITNLVNRFTEFFVKKASEFVLSIPLFLLNFFIMVFIVFYLLKQGDKIALRLENLLPLKKSHRKNVFNQLRGVTSAVIYGQIFTAAIQAAIGIIAFLLFGVSSPFLWGLMMFFFALIPFLGTPVVWIPALLLKLVYNEPFQAIGLLISGIFISTIDNVIRPKIVSGRAKVHPIIILLGVMGGILIFGPVGLIVGPVVLSLSLTFIKIYEEEISGEIES
jgi:predicted PurR-regulated permease PerM